MFDKIKQTGQYWFLTRLLGGLQEQMNESNTSSSIGYSLDFRKNSGCCFFCRERFLPEQASGRDCHLRRSLVRLRTASASVPSSGQHSLAGGNQITGTPTPAKGLFAGAGVHSLRCKRYCFLSVSCYNTI